MSDRLSRLESDLAELRRGLGDVERRLSRLETAHDEGYGVLDHADDRLEHGSEEAASGGVDSTRLVTLTGRTLVILGVGHLLRGLTGSGVVAPLAGILIGLVYALIWLVVARRAALRQRTRSAIAYGVGTSIIAFPLLWEAVTRFHVLSPAVGAGAAAATAILLVASAAQWRLYPLAIVAAIGGMVTSLALGIQSRALLPCTISILTLATVSLWIGWFRRWTALAWVTAPAANIAVLGVVLSVVVEKTWVTASAALLLGLALLMIYLVSAIVRLRASIWSEGSLSTFETVQNVASFVFGYGGAVWIARTTGEGTWTIVIPSLVLIAAAYASSFGTLAGGKLDRPAFSHFNTVALALVIAASWLALPVSGVVILWSALAVTGALLSSRLRRQTFGLHGAAAISAAALASGVVATALMVFTVSPDHVARLTFPMAGWPVLGAAVLGLWSFGAVPPTTGRHRAAVSRVVFWSVLALGIGALVVGVLAPIVATGDASDANLASLRTAVLAVSVTLLGIVSRRDRFSDARWLVYPLLALTALKLVVQDLPHGRPTNLFISLGCFGLALILAARLVTRTRKS